jgi:Transglutaminase-like superfamily
MKRPTAETALHPDAQHTHWSDPGIWSPRLGELPSDPAALPDALENFVIHHAIARSMGFGVPPEAETDRNLRTSAKLLETLVNRDSRPLSEHRRLPDYLYCTCHDFALLALSVLRENGVPARLRVGFASYFVKGKWEDHWVCEHRTGERWAVLDGQLGPRARAGFGIGFEVSDVPESGWRSAASIWRGIRSGEIDPQACGVSFIGISGAWFAAMSVLRDAAALAGIECLPWDYWGPGREICAAHDVTDEQARDIDALAAALEPAPASRDEAEAVLDRFPWARPTPTILSFPEGRASAEIVLVPAE